MPDENEKVYLHKTLEQWEAQGALTVQAEQRVSGPDHTWEAYFKDKPLNELIELDKALYAEGLNLRVKLADRLRNIERVRRAIHTAGVYPQGKSNIIGSE